MGQHHPSAAVALEAQHVKSLPGKGWLGCEGLTWHQLCPAPRGQGTCSTCCRRPRRGKGFERLTLPQVKHLTGMIIVQIVNNIL